MGLDTSHDCWHGAYSAFMRFRTEVAKAAGIPLRLMQGFYSPPDDNLVERSKLRASMLVPSGGGMMATRETLMAALADSAKRGDAGRWHLWASNFMDCLPLSWDYFADDPLVSLLNHSDCDGEIPADECGPLADRMEELMPEFEKCEAGWGHCASVADKARQFIAGLRRAAAANEPVAFH